MSEASDNEDDTLEENYYSILNVSKVGSGSLRIGSQFDLGVLGSLAPFGRTSRFHRLNKYCIISVFKDASKEEINAAFRQLSRLYHPDRHADPKRKKKV